MANTGPTNEEYLAVVSEWSSYGYQSTSRVGNAYPIFSITSNRLVSDPMTEFPNPGYIFLPTRGELSVWDYVHIRPVVNARYKDSNPRECYFIARTTPEALDSVPANCGYAVLLDLPQFDPTESANTIRNPGQNVTPVFFVRTPQQRIFGPLRRLQVSRTNYETIASIGWGPYGDDQMVYEFTAEYLEKKLKIVLLTYSHPESDLNEIVNRPIHLLSGPVLTAVSDKPYDRLSDSQLAEWYLKGRNHAEIPEEVMKTLRAAAIDLGDSQPQLIRQRCRRLGVLVTSLEVLQAERRIIARKYLDTEDGKRTLNQQLQLEVERRAEAVAQEVKKRQSELATEEQRLATRLQELREEARVQEKAMLREVNVLEAKQTELRDAYATLENQLARGTEHLADQVRESLPLLAVLAPALRGSPAMGVRPEVNGQALPVQAVRAEVHVPEPTRDLDEAADELMLVDCWAAELAGENLSFTRDFLANLFICLKASALNLITGPPGYGKSSVVGSLARALGHGNAFLEIAVRRSWSDDRYLLGFYDTFHGRYDPGPTGLATRLLQAQLDWEKDKTGLYCVLLDEFNLAAPEYYFSQLLQILTRPPDQRVLHLFDTESVASKVVDPLHQIRIYPNVSFWGTINYDETTERLSPRLLDRTGMIFLSSRDVLGAFQPGDAGARSPRRGVKAGHIFLKHARQAEQCPPDLWDLFEPLLELLRRQTDEWGAGIDLSPRVIEAVKRYLANSTGLLAPARAADFAFEQRVLPVLRGRGAGYAARMRALCDRLAERGLERSVRHVRDALGLSELHFGDVDFLAY